MCLDFLNHLSVFLYIYVFSNDSYQRLTKLFYDRKYMVNIQICINYIILSVILLFYSYFLFYISFDRMKYNSCLLYHYIRKYSK